MAIREVYVPYDLAPFYRAVPVEFTYNSGFALSQKQKNIIALHDGYHRINRTADILEISSKSLQEEGVAASAFNLLKYVPELDRRIPVENVFQGSKVFSGGGPYTNLYAVTPREAKRDVRLHESGTLVSFRYNGRTYPTKPLTAFYDYIYINALLENEELLKSVLRYDAFTDIEFNPEKSINCQAKAAAALVAIYKQGRICEVKTFDTFMALYGSVVERTEEKPVSKPQEDVSCTLADGTMIIHKLWGKGIVTDGGSSVTVLFEKPGIGKKKLSADWIIKNCKLCEK